MFLLGDFMLSTFVCLQVAFHIEPYKGRDEVNMYTNVKYVIEKWVVPCFFSDISVPWFYTLSHN